LGAVVVALAFSAAGFGGTPGPRERQLPEAAQAADSDDSCLSVRSAERDDVYCAPPPPSETTSDSEERTIPAGWDGSATGLPECILVDAGGTKVGCTRKTDMYADLETRDRLTAQFPLGLPVYDLDTQSKLVGFLTAIGFVPNALLAEFDALKACSLALTEELRSSTYGQLAADCQRLLSMQGVPAKVLAGR
jgi:hypothetical protein